MEKIIIKSCAECPVSIMNDIACGYSCGLDRGKMIKAHHKTNKQLSQIGVH